VRPSGSLASASARFCRQKATRASRQTALLAVLIALFQPDMGKIAAAAAALDRRAARPELSVTYRCAEARPGDFGLARWRPPRDPSPAAVNR